VNIGRCVLKDSLERGLTAFQDYGWHVGKDRVERIFVLALCRQIALCAAWLVHQPARLSLAQALLLSMIHRHTPTLRA
jgi:hypothetical protein